MSATDFSGACGPGTWVTVLFGLSGELNSRDSILSDSQNNDRLVYDYNTTFGNMLVHVRIGEQSDQYWIKYKKDACGRLAVWEHLLRAKLENSESLTTVIRF